MTKREEKKSAKRLEIFNVAMKLFAKKGYDAVTTAEIAQESHIAKKTLFQYFRSKEDIIFDDDEEKLIGTIISALEGADDVWKAYTSFLLTAEAADDHHEANYSPEALQLPTIILQRDALYGRLLKLWAHYESRLKAYLVTRGYAPLNASALAANMVYVFRETFDGSSRVAEVLDHLQSVTQQISQ